MRATSARLRLQARDIRAETRRVVAAARRTRFHLVTQGERFRAVQAAIRLQRLRRAWGESGQ
ncbi:hypothetical protein HCN51_50410 [Nonomuraea sp. FMUSA5-5]|uniref:Uncharacterized protein n=1 Tax=Nonomuraea composti TaxID=2720023 RepID=A0ABX1BQM2_9ACTN|nr:hypothetical protein [Nonomuraea sp. FMUSA5-5]NJP97551.1 hypothetical protein [Nonomuraea sp. FMUSA5-5]